MKETDEEIKVWFTSDQHFYHYNIIKYCRRPFADLDEMHSTIVDNFKAIVGPNDIVYHLGDYAMAKRKYTKKEQFQMYREIMDELPGKHILIRGNHDRGKDSLFLDIGFYKISTTIKFDKQRIIMVHNPDAIGYAHAPHGWRWIVGHVHDSWRRRIWKSKKTKMINVGVDVNNFTPIGWDELAKEFKGNGWNGTQKK